MSNSLLGMCPPIASVFVWLSLGCAALLPHNTPETITQDQRDCLTLISATEGAELATAKTEAAVDEIMDRYDVAALKCVGKDQVEE